MLWGVCTDQSVNITWHFPTITLMRVYACACLIDSLNNRPQTIPARPTQHCAKLMRPGLGTPPHSPLLARSFALSPPMHTRTHAHARILLPTKDFFNPNDYANQPSVLRSVDYGARNRLASKAHSATIVQCSTMLTCTCTCKRILRQLIVLYTRV